MLPLHQSRTSLLSKKIQLYEKQIVKMFFLIYLYTVDTVVRVIWSTLIIKTTKLYIALINV